MAGDWIKMSTDLRTHPKVVRISSALHADRLRVVGGLHAVWCLFDAHSEDGSLAGYTLEALDDLVGWPGFAAAMVAVEWIEADPAGLNLPRFDAHNGASAKRRAQESERKRVSRTCPEPVREMSASDADKKRTREEKRREEEEIEPPPLRGSPRPSRKCPEHFVITDELRQWASAETPGVNLDAETKTFRDHTFRTAISAWEGAWRNWMRRAFKSLPKVAHRGAIESFAQRAARERVEQMSPGLAAKAPGAKPITEFFDAATKLIA